jgi:hypothetical protein
MKKGKKVILTFNLLSVPKDSDKLVLVTFDNNISEKVDSEKSDTHQSPSSIIQSNDNNNNDNKN